MNSARRMTLASSDYSGEVCSFTINVTAQGTFYYKRCNGIVSFPLAVAAGNSYTFDQCLDKDGFGTDTPFYTPSPSFPPTFTYTYTSSCSGSGSGSYP